MRSLCDQIGQFRNQDHGRNRFCHRGAGRYFYGESRCTVITKIFRLTDRTQKTIPQSRSVDGPTKEAIAFELKWEAKREELINSNMHIIRAAIVARALSSSQLVDDRDDVWSFLMMWLRYLRKYGQEIKPQPDDKGAAATQPKVRRPWNLDVRLSANRFSAASFCKL